MARFAGIRNGEIQTISNSFFEQDDLQIIEIPVALEQVETLSLMNNYCVRDNIITLKKPNKSISELKVAFINNWKQQCGISTYSESIINALLDQVQHYKLFIEENDSPTGSFYSTTNHTIPSDSVEVCWKRGYSLLKLVNAVKSYDPDVVVIQHEYGIFPDLKYWLSLLTQLSSYKVVVVLHSVFYHWDKLLAEAPIKNIIVHLEGAKETLQAVKKVSGNITVIPHGCLLPDTTGKLWNFYHTRHSFVQMGFLFRYKGWSNSLETVALLKEKFPDVFFTGILSEPAHPDQEFQRYYDTLLKQTQELQIEDNVGFIRGFQNETVIESVLKTNTAAIFPYISEEQHKVWGASGAARTAMAMQLPVISSSIPHFSDLPTIKADTPKEMAEALGQIFSNQTAEMEQIQKQNQYLMENSWAEIASKYISVLL